MWCDACRAVGMIHCAHPDECGNMLPDPAAIREAAAKTLLDMLYMRNGAQNGMTRDDVQRIWDAASTREGYAAVEAFLLALIDKGESHE